ncbi:MAG: dodecin family protein [Saprospiraceae bacterium]|nr:dodecin family protein [Saprospiraceae bacterium]
MIKVIELMSSSPSSWTDATNQAIKKASKTMRNLKSAHIQNFSATVDKGKIKEYRVNLKLSFEVE